MLKVEAELARKIVIEEIAREKDVVHCWPAPADGFAHDGEPLGGIED